MTKGKRTNSNIHKTKDWVTRTPLKTGRQLRCSDRVGSSCSSSGTHRVNIVTNLVIRLKWGKDREVLTLSGTYRILSCLIFPLHDFDFLYWDFSATRSPYLFPVGPWIVKLYLLIVTFICIFIIATFCHYKLSNKHNMPKHTWYLSDNLKWQLS
jgi:hypothetical protein